MRARVLVAALRVDGVFNPIEFAFAKLEAFVRAVPRTFDQVVALMAVAIDLFSPQECANFVHHCGYRAATTL